MATGKVPFRLDITGCLETAIAGYGLTSAELEATCKGLEPGFRQLQVEARTGSLALLAITRQEEDLKTARQAFEALCEGASTIIFFGTGGSGLGGQTLAQVAGWNIPGVSMPNPKTRPRTRFYDNLDPSSLAGALSDTDLATARFVVTSKSGGTAETLAQAIVTLSAVKDAGLAERIPQMFLGITEEAKAASSNGLRALFAEHGIPILPHPNDIGGRFSCLTIVGLLPALARGLDPAQIRAGAANLVDELLAAPSPADFAPALSAAVSVALAKLRGTRVSVLMPYADRLGYLARWYAQLWAESLGKGGKGTTPLAALGPLDQHSQLQLFMDGPREFLITLIRVATAGTGPKIDPGMARTAGANYMAGRTIGDIVAAQADALPEALASARCPVRTIDIHSLDERSIGAVMMHFMMETILAGRLLGIDPFDQPAVELAKVLTRERLAEKPT
jgi:glucose-6-phosphate isomerase